MLTKLTTQSELPAEDEAKEFKCGEKEICVANVNGTISAMDNICLHRGGPLGEGQLEGKVVTCPWHGWQFDVTTGKAVQNPNAGVGCFKTEIRGDEVFVDPA